MRGTLQQVIEWVDQGHAFPRLTPKQLKELRRQLALANIRIVPINQDDPLHRLYTEPKFRRVDHGRGFGLQAALGSHARAERFVDWCNLYGRELEWYVIGENQESPGRGIMQTAADLLVYAMYAGDDDITNNAIAEQYRLKLNVRLRKGNEKRTGGQSLRVITSRFNGAQVPQAKSTTASMPPGTFGQMYEHLLVVVG